MDVEIKSMNTPSASPQAQVAGSSSIIYEELTVLGVWKEDWVSNSNQQSMNALISS